ARALKLEEPDAPNPQNLASEMAEVRRQLAKMSLLVTRSAVRSGRRISTAPNPALDELDQALMATNIDADLVCSILRNLESMGSASACELRQACRKDIQGRVQVSADLSPWSFETSPGPGSGSARAIAALVACRIEFVSMPLPDVARQSISI